MSKFMSDGSNWNREIKFIKKPTTNGRKTSGAVAGKKPAAVAAKTK
jgi:hypothetical protein